MYQQTTVPTKEHTSDFAPWADALSPYAYDDAAMDFLEEVEDKAPAFSVHTIRPNHYVAIIDPTWIKKFNSEFKSETIHRITGIEAPQLLGGIVLYFRSKFPVTMIKQAIKFSFL